MLTGKHFPSWTIPYSLLPGVGKGAWELGFWWLPCLLFRTLSPQKCLDTGPVLENLALVFRSGVLFFMKSQSLDFTNKDPGARYWGESLLSQRGIESPQLTFLLSHHATSLSFLQLSQTTVLKLSVPPFYFLDVSLSILLTPSFSLCFFLTNPMSTSSTGCLLCLLTYGWLYSILFTVFK